MKWIFLVSQTFLLSLMEIVLNITILGDSRNYIPPILVPSSAKRIATQIVVIAKLNGRNYFGRFCLWYHSCQQGITSVFIVKCGHISNFVLIVDFEQGNVCLVYIEKSNTFEDNIGHTRVML